VYGRDSHTQAGLQCPGQALIPSLTPSFVFVLGCEGRGLASLLREGLPSRRRVHTVHSSRTHDATCFIIHAHYGKSFGSQGVFLLAAPIIFSCRSSLSHFH
jgi:hypothetical protein